MSVRVLHKNREESRPEWAALIASELEQAERRLALAVFSEVPAAADMSIHILSAGGKRIRPALAILSALASGAQVDEDRLIGIAAAIELVHTASLVHDDVVDETHERRGVTTASAEWGNTLSVLGGDFLLAKAFSLLATCGTQDVIRALAATAVRMTESEMLQVTSEGSLSLWEANYWRIIRDKTANFLGACCECGALLVGADPEVRGALTHYGVHLGLAFQIMDDVLDIVGDPVQTGKAVGTDLTHGKFTLPVLLALQNLDDGRKRAMLALLNRSTLTQQEAREVASVVIDCGAVELARRAACDCADKALGHLAELPQSEYVFALENLASFVITRDA